MTMHAKYLYLPLSSLLLAWLNACGQPYASELQEGTEKHDKGTFHHVVHKAETRGETNAGWLLGKHSFSFGEYYDPNKMHFGALRVLNDDRIDPMKGFRTHPHRNMEIITIPLGGVVEHQDNMGNEGVIKTGDVQIMSAGKGITHSEFNPSQTDTLRLLQIWVLPNKQDVTPRYQQINGILKKEVRNEFKKLVAPNDSNALFLYQNTVFSMGKFDKGNTYRYPVAFKGNGVYAFMIEGTAKLNGIPLNSRDAIGIWDTDSILLETTTDTHILFLDVPMLE